MNDESIGNKEDKITGKEEMNEDNENTGIRREKRKKLRTHIISAKMWLI